MRGAVAARFHSVGLRSNSALEAFLDIGLAQTKRYRAGLAARLADYVDAIEPLRRATLTS